MQLAMLGLGRMGGNMAQRLLQGGHQVIVYDVDPRRATELAGFGATPATTLDEVIAALKPPRVCWTMVPAGRISEELITSLAARMQRGDVIVDGGNSYFKDSQRRAKELAERGIRYCDAGTSGGIWGLKNGYCLMVGGPREAYERCEPIFKALAPEDGGLVHTGPECSGHFVKMVHNGIEYGLMQAYAEGFDILKRSSAFPGMDMHAIAEAWRSGSVVRSWLLDLIADGLSKDPDLAGIEGYVEDTGEGRWTVAAAIEDAVPAPAITLALYERFRSRLENTFGDRMLAMMRNQFGGHAVKTTRP
jgi:6-phosphogluconate dehydrogenase